MVSAEKEKIDVATEHKECFSCKMISGTLLLLASVHVFTRGASGKLRSTKIISAIFGTSNNIFCLGMTFYTKNQRTLSDAKAKIFIKRMYKMKQFVMSLID